MKMREKTKINPQTAIHGFQHYNDNNPTKWKQIPNLILLKEYKYDYLWEEKDDSKNKMENGQIFNGGLVPGARGHI